MDARDSELAATSLLAELELVIVRLRRVVCAEALTQYRVVSVV